MKNRILLTGAAGFIGSHTALKLSKLGHTVVGIDSFNDYYCTNLKRARAKKLAEAGIALIESQVEHVELLEAIAKEHNVTHILHLAAQAGVRHSLENPQSYVTSNILGFLSVLELLRKAPQIKLAYASSSSVYGVKNCDPLSLDCPTDAQASFYGVTKKSNELMAACYRHQFGIHATGLRYFTVYGPWGRPDMAYYIFTKAMMEGKPIDLFNNGVMLRDFTYIDDIVDGTIAALFHSSPSPVYNLGSSEPKRLMEMIEILEELLDTKAKLQYLPMQMGDVPATFADIKESQKELGFRPKTSLYEGLRQFVNWYKSYNSSGLND